MNKIRLLIIFTSLAYAFLSINSSAVAEIEKKFSHSKAEYDAIQDVMEDINISAESGDELLVSKLLASAVQSHPKIADRIIGTFIDKQQKSNYSVDISAIMQNVVTRLQSQKANETIIATVLNAYPPAYGKPAEVNVNSVPEAKNNSGKLNLPPELPPTGQGGGGGKSNPK